MKIWIVPLLALALSGCITTGTTPTSVTVTKYQVITPPPSLYKCPDEPAVPAAETATEVQAGKYIAGLRSAYRTCKASNNSIKKFENKAKAAIER